MVYLIGPFIFGELTAFQDALELNETYRTPHDLLRTPSLLLPQKKTLLKGWYDNRMRYVFENGRDCDYLLDPEIQEITRVMDVLRETLSTQDHIGIRINIYSFKP